MDSIQAKNVNHPEYREPLKRAKYRHIRDAILGVLSAEDGRELTFDELEQGVHAHFKKNPVPDELFPKPGSVRWYTKAVQLDLEARGALERIPGRSPLALRLTPDAGTLDLEP